MLHDSDSKTRENTLIGGKRYLSIKEASTAYGIGKDAIEAAEKIGNLAVKWNGNKRLICVDEMERYMATLPTERTA